MSEQTPRTQADVDEMLAVCRTLSDEHALNSMTEYARLLTRELTAAQAALKKAEEDAKHVRQANANYRRENEIAMQRAEAAEQRAAEMEKDAERYRWLRRASSTGKQTRAQEIMFARYYPEADIDAAIDAAREER